MARNFTSYHLLLAAAFLCPGSGMGFSVIPTAGLFTTIKVSQRDFPALKIAYKTYTSSYKDSGKYMEAAKKAASGSPNFSTIGLFLDDPGSVPSDMTRYAVGITVDEGQTELEKRLRARGYEICELPQTPAIWTTFPVESLVSMVVGKLRVYPKLEEYSKAIARPAGPFAEICKNGDKETHFYGMLDNRNAFMLGLESPEKYSARVKRG